MNNVRLTNLQAQLLDAIQLGFPLASDPYAELAAGLGVDAHTLRDNVAALRREGIIRRIGGSFVAAALGYRSTLAAVRVVHDRIETVAARVSVWTEVTHNYERARGPDWPFNLYAMIHGRTEAEVRAVAAEAVASNPAIPFRLLFSLREFKKTSIDLGQLGG